MHPFCSAWHFVPAWHFIHSVIPSVIPSVITSLAFFCYLAVGAHAMVCSGGSGTVIEEIADAHVEQCSINNIVSVYVSSVHLQTMCLHV